MKKSRELDRLGHFVLRQLATNFAKQSKLKDEIDNNPEVSKKEKRKLYADILDAGLETQLIVANVMSAAENSDTFRFTVEDQNTLSIQDVAARLGIKIKKCCKDKKPLLSKKDQDIKEKLEEVGQEIAKKMGVDSASVHAIKMTPEAAAAMGEMLETISKKQGEK